MIQFGLCMKRSCLLLLLLFLSCRRQYETGRAVYQGECVKCHKLHGEGGTKGPDLTDIFSKKDERYIRQYTIDPRSIKSDGTMPPSKISDRELNLVIQYMKEQTHQTSK
jgi:putative heme-binding domain-containing protein